MIRQSMKIFLTDKGKKERIEHDRRTVIKRIERQ